MSPCLKQELSTTVTSTPRSTTRQGDTSAITQRRCGCWSQRPASEGKLITKGLSQSAMDFQLPWERWPWNSFSCEIWCRVFGQNGNQPVDSFRWPAPDTSWIFQWWYLIESGFCFAGPVGWAERDRERNKKWLRICHRVKSVQPPPPLLVVFQAFLPLSNLTLWLFNFLRPAGTKRLKEGLHFLHFIS